MTIEFHFPQGKIKELLMDSVKSSLLEFHHKDKTISRAEVYFKEQDTEKICEIDLNIFGDSLLVRRAAKTFSEAAMQAIETLSNDVAAHIKSKSEIPEEIVSTVQV